MPNRSSSETPGGRGRPSRRRIGGEGFDARRSSPKRGSDNQKDRGESFPKRSAAPRKNSRSFGEEGNSSKKGGFKKSYDSPGSKPEFRGKRDRRDETPGSGKDRYSKGGQRPKSDKDFRGKRDETPGAEKKYSPTGRRDSKFDKDARGKRDESSSAGRKYSSGGRYTKFDKDFRGKKDENSDGEKGRFEKRPRYPKSDKPNFRSRGGDTFDSAKSHSSRAEGKPKFDKGHFRKKTSGGEKQSVSEESTVTGKIRLNKFISNSGVCSRREADELITLGLISVNGVTITELGYKVNASDEVRHEGKLLRREKPVYILMNKPKGFLTTTSDPEERNTVMHLIANHVKERVYPVGRLDRNTTGLLLLTNDGDLAEKLMHPSYNVKKIYKVDLDRPLTKGDAQQIIDGVRLEEGVAMVDDLAIVSDDRKTIGLEIHIGWNRVIRRIFEALEYEVVKLDRSVYAGLTKKDLGRGEWRFLKNEELVILKHLQ